EPDREDARTVPVASHLGAWAHGIDGGGIHPPCPALPGEAARAGRRARSGRPDRPRHHRIRAVRRGRQRIREAGGHLVAVGARVSTPCRHPRPLTVLGGASGGGYATRWTPAGAEAWRGRPTAGHL